MYVVGMGIKLECPKEECGYEWDYNGESDFYATCPRCKSSVKIPEEARIDEGGAER